MPCIGAFLGPLVVLPAALARSAATAVLLDVQGRAVRCFALPAGLGRHTLPLAEVAPGIYTLRLTLAGQPVTKRVMVEEGTDTELANNRTYAAGTGIAPAGRPVNSKALIAMTKPQRGDLLIPLRRPGSGY